MARQVSSCLHVVVTLGREELLAAHDSTLRDHVPAHPRLGTVIERIGPLILTHYGTRCIVEHPALNVEASAVAAQLVAQVQASAAERAEPLEWRVFAHDRAASQLAEALDGAGFTAGWERSVLIGEAAEADFPQPAAECKVASVRWDEAEARQALELSARSGPHRVPLEAWYAMRSVPYWDVDIRVLTHRGSAIAACWLEDVRDTAFVTVGGLTAPRSELLAELPLWRFQPPTKKFLVADADGDVRDVLIAADFCEVTTVQSYNWAPPGEPAAAPPARPSLDDSEYLHIARRCEARIGFDYASGSGRYTVPVDSRTWFYGTFGGYDDPVIEAAERVIELGLRACVPPGEWVYEYRPYLNGWEFDPHRVGNPGQPRWPGNAFADREFQFLTTADARVGTFGHYAEQTLVVFGNDLVEHVGKDLDRLLGGGAWTFD